MELNGDQVRAMEPENQSSLLASVLLEGGGGGQKCKESAG